MGDDELLRQIRSARRVCRETEHAEREATGRSTTARNRLFALLDKAKERGLDTLDPKAMD